MRDSWRHSRAALFLTPLVLTLGLPTHGQSPGVVSGTVRDPSGRPLESALVTIAQWWRAWCR